MKKVSALLLLGAVAIIYYACKKESSHSVDQQLIDQARQYFTSIQSSEIKTAPGDEKTRLQTNKLPLWNQAISYYIEPHREIVVVPLHYDKGIFLRSNLDTAKMYDINQIAKLVIYKDSKAKFHAEIVTTISDSNYAPSKSFSGVVLVEDWYGNFLREFKYDKYGIRQVSKENTIQSTTLANQPSTLTVCTYLEGYTYVVTDPSNTYNYSESLGCTTYYLDGPNTPDALSANNYSNIAGSGGAGTSANTIVEYSGNKPVPTIANYIHCFQINSLSTYSVTLYVDQPVANNRTSYSSFGSSGSGLSIGHAFLTFTQNQQGVITRRSLGLYPSGTVTPLTPTSKGSLNDDEGHTFDVSLTITLTPSQFTSILNACANGNNTLYNLNTNNCVTWTLSSLAAGNIIINTKKGSWPFGGGDDPGDLGQDLRALSLSSNMSLTTNMGYAPANLNFCN